MIRRACCAWVAKSSQHRRMFISLAKQFRRRRTPAKFPSEDCVPEGNRLPCYRGLSRFASLNEVVNAPKGIASARRALWLQRSAMTSIPIRVEYLPALRKSAQGHNRYPQSFFRNRLRCEGFHRLPCRQTRSDPRSPSHATLRHRRR